MAVTIFADDVRVTGVPNSMIAGSGEEGCSPDSDRDPADIRGDALELRLDEPVLPTGFELVLYAAAEPGDVVTVCVEVAAYMFERHLITWEVEEQLTVEE